MNVVHAFIGIVIRKCMLHEVDDEHHVTLGALLLPLQNNTFA
jgi:hypothetical protein